MNKGLEAFNKFCDSVNACVNSGGITNIDLKAKEQVEKELKEKTEQDVIISVIKEVIEFGLFDEKVEYHEEGLSITQQIGIRARREITAKEKELYRWFILNQCFPKELKALEILRNNKVNLEYLKCCENYEQYKTICSYWNEISKEEYDLIKEELLCQSEENH